MSEYAEKNVLAIDTTTSTLHLAIAFAGDRLVKLNEDVGNSHGQMLVRKISDLLISAGIGVADLHALTCSTGPGSFTGLRIGLAAAKGIAVAHDIPVVGVSLFDIAGYRLRDSVDPAWVAVPFKRDECFATEISNGTYEVDDIKAVPHMELPRLVGRQAVWGIGLELGEIFAAAGSDVIPETLEYDAADMLHIGIERLNSGLIDDLTLLEPMYLQKSQAEIRFARKNRKE